MKKFFFLLYFFSLASQNLFAQTNVYHPFPDSNAVWVESDWYADTQNFWTVTTDENVFINGDTVQGNFTYHKVYSNTYAYCSCGWPPGYYTYGIYKGAFRNDWANKKVYFLISGGKDTLAYDFNLTVGNYLPASYINYANSNKVIAIDSVLVGNSYHKRYVLNIANFNNVNYALIEGIGSTLGLFDHITAPFESGSDLWCVRINNNIVWKYTNSYVCSLLSATEIPNPSSIQILPNPSNGIFIVRSNGVEVRSIEIYNTLGEKIHRQIITSANQPINLSSHPKGIYYLRLVTRSGAAVAGKIVIE